MYALNFYSPIVAEQLRSGRKTATIRLGDKSAKYRKGMIVQVLAGHAVQSARAGVQRGDRQGRGEGAVGAVPARDRARQPGDPPHRGHGAFLSRLYNREVTPDDTVTVIRFSQIKD